MSYHKRAAKVDGNQAEIVKVLREAGATVQPLHTVGSGCPDLLVGFRGRNYLLEVKDGRKPPSARKLTPDQKPWHEAWRGQARVVTNLFEALEAIGAAVRA
jgi:hypothetical protein